MIRRALFIFVGLQALLFAGQSYAQCDENSFIQDIGVPYMNVEKSPATPLTMHQAYELVCTRSANARQLYYLSLSNIEKQRQLMLNLHRQRLIRDNEKAYYTRHFAQSETDIKNCRSRVRDINRPIAPNPMKFQIEWDEPLIELQIIEAGQISRRILTNQIWVGLLLNDEGFKLCEGAIVDNRPSQ